MDHSATPVETKKALTVAGSAFFVNVWISDVHMTASHAHARPHDQLKLEIECRGWVAVISIARTWSRPPAASRQKKGARRIERPYRHP